MPPGRHRSGPRRRMRVNGASVSGLLNAGARTEEEVRANARRVFGGLLGAVLAVDLASAVSVVAMACSQQSRCWSGGTSVWRCLVDSVLHASFGASKGLPPHGPGQGETETETLGDFVVLSLCRCALTLLLLWVGVRFGNEGTHRREPPEGESGGRSASGIAIPSGSDRSETETEAETETESNGAPGSLEEPLLGAGRQDRELDTGEPSLRGNRERGGTPSGSLPATESPPARERSLGCPASVPRDPKAVKKMVLVLVVVFCTLYQVYAGFRVATMQDGGGACADTGSSDDDHHHHGTGRLWSVLRIVLLCSTILWINAEAYLVSVLVVELTRDSEEGLLFLPPEIHRHPLYLETDHRSMAMHWCDLCGQKIQQATPAAPNRGGGSSNRNNGSHQTAAPTAVCRVATTPSANSAGSKSAGYCYRCALCDFDICLKCSARTDAAVVGEHVLRGDRGVRAEASLSTRKYVERSLGVAGRTEWPWLALSFFLLALSSATRLLLPHVQGRIIDEVVPVTGANHTFYGGAGGENGNGSGSDRYDRHGFVRCITIYVFVMIAQGALSTLYSAIFTLVSRKLKFTVRNALFEKILVQDVAYFDGTESGRLLSRLTNDLDVMMSPIQSSLSNLLSNSLLLMGGMAVCFLKSYRLSMLAFSTVGPISHLWEQYALWSKGLAKEMLSHWAQGNSIASQALSHIRTVKAFGCEEVVLRKYSETNRMALDCGVKDAWGNGVTSALTGYLDLGTGVLILYFGGLLVYRGEMTVGDLVTYQLFWNMMNGAYQNLQGLVTSFTRSAAGAEKVFALWDSHPDIDPSVGTDVVEDQIQGHLQLQGVGFYYQMRPDNQVLEDFDLEIPAGKTLALVGRSGGGKSTIINLLLRFYDPKNGRILLDGKPYPSFKVHQLRRLFGVVTQDTELFASTVEENIVYGLDEDEYTFEDVVSAAKKAHAHEFISAMKDGYQTRIGERGGRISGGQRQRLAIARVFLRKPKIILLDEATSALDERSQEAVQEALADLITESSATVVMVAHRLSTVVNADSICVIDGGRVQEQGSHEELLQREGGIYASMVSQQAVKKQDELPSELR